MSAEMAKEIEMEDGGSLRLNDDSSIDYLDEHGNISNYWARGAAGWSDQARHFGLGGQHKYLVLAYEEGADQSTAEQYEVDAPNAMEAAATARDWYESDFHAHDVVIRTSTSLIED